jgi:Gluconate 2-dehydrogenase subunit 3
MLDRRTVIQNLIGGGLVLGLVPGVAETAWSALSADAGAPRVLTAAQSSAIAITADALLPRSDTPSATDVGIVRWIDLIVADCMSENERANFLAGLTAMNDFAQATYGTRLQSLSGGPLEALMASLDASLGAADLTPAQRGYKRLKELVVHGYFTSKPVQRDILKVVIVPGRFDANVLIPRNAT